MCQCSISLSDTRLYFEIIVHKYLDQEIVCLYVSSYICVRAVLVLRLFGELMLKLNTENVVTSCHVAMR